MTRSNPFLRILSSALPALVFVTLAGCGSPSARAPNPHRPVDEGRAASILADAVRRQGLQPAAAREISLTTGKQIRMDVAVDGKKYGFVYLTAGDIRQLGDDPLVTANQAQGGDLIVRSGGSGHIDDHFVVLYATDYLYDDNVGEEHEATMITAENKLDRDARDFLVIAKKQGWP